MSQIAHARESDGETQTLEAHLHGVGAKAAMFAEKLGLGEQGEMIGLLHDLGKYSDEFQSYIRSAAGLIDADADDYVDASGLRGKVDHSTAGAQLAWEMLSHEGEVGTVVGQLLAVCIASHHSGLIDCLSSRPDRSVEDSFTRRITKTEDRVHRREAVHKMDASIKGRLEELRRRSKLVEGLKVAMRDVMERDAVAGVDPINNRVTQFKLGLLMRFLFSCLIDADRIDTIDFERPKRAEQRPGGKYEGWKTLIERLEKHLLNLNSKHPEVDVIRKKVSDSCLAAADRSKGIFTLTVPTGGGKTLASLRFALRHASLHGMSRIIYVVPFTSIIDQNADVVRGILEPAPVDRGKVVLEHHSNLTPERQGWREKMLAENWDAPVVFTTGVQLLEALFGAGTRGARRMHQLADAILIFDEIQTLPINCVHLFCNAMNFLTEHCGATVVLCTATQPLLHRVDAKKGRIKLAENSELMPDVAGLFRDLRRVEILDRRKPGGWSDRDVAELAWEEVAQRGSCLVVVNTKRCASSLYEACRTESDAELFHLSASMCPAHRRVVLNEIRRCLDQRSPLLCISTQLIEAGVDVDFASVIRYAAGLDSIAQAAGRCNRNGRLERGRVHVVNPSAESLAGLTEIRRAKEITERLCDDWQSGIEDFDGDLLSPRAIERYFDYYFFQRRREMEYPVGPADAGRNDTLLNLLSTNPLAREEYERVHRRAPGIYFRQSFMAAGRAFKAIDAATRGVIVPYGQEGKDLIGALAANLSVEEVSDLLRRAQQYSVNVFPHLLEKLKRSGAVHRIRQDMDVLCLLDSRYYSLAFGLSESPRGELEVYCA